MEKFVVSRDDGIYEAWPDLLLTNAGELLCFFTECRHHGDRHDSRIVIKRSGDRGRSWSPKEYLTEKTQPDESGYYNNARASVLPDGRVSVLCDRVYGDENRSSRVFLWIGDRDGRNFGPPAETPGSGIVPDKLRVTGAGRWLLLCHMMNPDTGKLCQYLWYSDDEGKTWSSRVTVADDPRYHLCEGNLVDAKDGTLCVLMRENSALGLPCMKAFSYDNGETWDGVYPMPLPGCHRPTAGFLCDGRLLVTYRFLQGGKGGWGAWTQNVFAALSDRESLFAKDLSAQSTRILPLDYDRSPVADLGYTGWVQFKDGEIYVVTYLVDDAPTAQIRGYSLTMKDFILG